MAVRLDQIQSDIYSKTIRLSDIPDAILTPDEIEALANKEFDYADKERVTLREAQRKVNEQMLDENRRRNLIEVNKVFGTNFDTAYKGPKDTLTQGVDLDKFTVGKKIHEAAKAVQRGSGQALKLPGVALKAIGELPYNRQEIQDKKRSDWALQRIHGAYLDSKMGKTIRQGFDMIRRAGNAYIDKVNSMMLQPSAETKAVMEQPFTSAPIFRTALAVGESAPTYGAALAATLTTGHPWAGLAIIGTTTAGSSYDNLRSMGVDPDLALVGAAIEGSIEVATEKLPMDELMKGGARPLLVRALRLGTMESFQELFAQMGQNYVDAVVKDTDPKDYSTLLKAARQEWQTIINGWEDAMAAGFIMGGGASMFSPAPETYMSKQDMVDEFGILPQQDQAFLSKLQEIREKVNVISEQAQQEIKEEAKPETAKSETYTDELTGRVLPSREIPGRPQRTKPLSTNAMLEKFSQKIESPVDIQIQFENEIQQNQYDVLLEKANAGDKRAVRQLSEFIQATSLPTYDALLERVNIGDMEALAQIEEGNYYGGENAKVKLTIPKQKLESIKYKLEANPELSEQGGVEPVIISEPTQNKSAEEPDGKPEQTKPAEPVAEVSLSAENKSQKSKPDKGLLSKLTDDEYSELEKLEKEFQAKIKKQMHRRGGFVDISILTNTDWGKIARYLKKLGYDVRNAADALGIYTQNRNRGYDMFQKHEDWKKAYQIITGQLDTEEQKEAPITNIDFDRIKELGTTDNPREAGYLTTTGDFIDLSGKKEGGQPGTRSFDHREAGGTAGMLEFMNLGNIRLMPESGYIDIMQPMTPLQEDKIVEFLEWFDGEIIIDLQDGIGEWDEANKHYKQAGRRTSKEYQSGTNPKKIISDIKKFYQSQATPKKSVLDNLSSDEKIKLKSLEKQLKDKVNNQLRTGLDPELFILATKIGSYYVRAGYRSFAQWAKQVTNRIGTISNYTLRTVYANLRNEFPDLDPDTEIDKVMVFGVGEDIGEGEEEVRSLPKSILALAIEKELIQNNEELYGSLPTYQKMSMAVQAEKAARLIESDLNRAKRIAFYQEAAPPDLFPENVVTALSIYATMQGDIDLIMDIALRGKAATVATTLGKRIKSLDTGEEYADPIRAIREVVEARKEAMAKRGKDVSALEAKLRELQAQLESTQRKFEEYVQQAQTKAKREYGSRNTLVTKVEYESIVARRKQEAAQLRRGKRLGAAYVPTPQDFSDLAKIGMYHLEALGRDFAKWSFKVTKDLGDWVAPHLQGQYDKLIQEAEAKGSPIPESKRLTAKKKRLATGISKTEQKFEEIDFAKEPQLDIELDEEGQKLQSAYDIAKAKLKAAQETANIITEEEVRIIAQLAQEVAKRKQAMENSPRRAENEPATKTEMEYGVSVFTFLEYINDLKAKAAKKSVSETIQNYLVNPVDFITDLAGTMKAAKASLDNSFHGRQGLITLLKGLTGDIASGKIWWDTFWKSWDMMKQAMQGKKVMAPLFAEIVSDPEYELLKKSKVALFSIEEEIPVDIPSRLPLVGVLFRMGENAFVGSSHYMRYKLAKNYFRVWRKSGVELTTRELESIGRLANSQTGRGDSLSKSQKPGLLNNLFWSPRNLRAYVDILTIHAFDREFSAMARKQAAINLLRYISGAAFILALADWIDDDSVTWEPTSSDFGKIKVGNSRFSVGGGAAVLVVLASRLVKRSYVSSTTGEEKSLDSGKYGALEGRDLVFNFLENKLSPAASMALAVINNKSWEGDKLTVPQMANDALTPMIIQNAIETGNVEDSANILAVLIAEALGVGVQTYSPKEPKGKKKPASIW